MSLLRTHLRRLPTDKADRNKRGISNKIIHRRKRTQSLTGLKVRHGRKHTAIREQGFRGSDTVKLVSARKDVELGVDKPSRSYRIVQSGV